MEQETEVTAVSRAKAIRDNCRECIYDPAEKGTWRQQTEACTIRSCAFWPFRPKSLGKKHPK